MRLEDIADHMRAAGLAAPILPTMLVNVHFMPIFVNFLCSFRALAPEQGILFLAQDRRTQDMLRRRGECSYLLGVDMAPEHRTAIEGLSEGADGLSYGSTVYQTLMHERTDAVRRLLLHNMTLLLEDADTLWLRDPRPLFADIARLGFDMAGIDDSYENICGGFLFMRPTPATVALWSNMTERHGAELRRIVEKRRSPELWSEQSELNKLLYTEGWAKDQRVRLKVLPADQFLTGQHAFAWGWSLKPALVVHNNFSRGQTYKMERFRKRHLYFVREGVDLDHVDAVCLPLVVPEDPPKPAAVP